MGQWMMLVLSSQGHQLPALPQAFGFSGFDLQIRRSAVNYIRHRLGKKEDPGCKVVFVGPCAAKKLEAIRADIRSDVDFVLTF